MGKIATLILSVVFGGMVSSRAADFHLINNQFTHVYTNTVSAIATNGVTSTNTLGSADSIYHTYHFVYSVPGTNVISEITERTLDGVDYFPVVTNSFLFTNSAIFEYQYTGKWVGYRFRTTYQNTNTGTLNIYYMGQ